MKLKLLLLFCISFIVSCNQKPKNYEDYIRKEFNESAMVYEDTVDGIKVKVLNRGLNESDYDYSKFYNAINNYFKPYLEINESDKIGMWRFASPYFETNDTLLIYSVTFRDGTNKIDTISIYGYHTRQNQPDRYNLIKKIKKTETISIDTSKLIGFTIVGETTTIKVPTVNGYMDFTTGPRKLYYLIEENSIYICDSNDSIYQKHFAPYYKEETTITEIE